MAPASTVDAHLWHAGADYDRYVSRIQARNARIVAGMLPPDPAGRVCEIGCGTGALTVLLAGALPHAAITAVDVSAGMLEVARRKGLPPRVEFVHASFLDRSWPQGYDAVASNAALHWMYPEYGGVFATVRRMLRPGGVFVAATAGRTPAAERFDGTVAAAITDAVDTPDIAFSLRRLDGADVRRLAADNGFDVEELFTVERVVTMPVGDYARWWVASGGPSLGAAVAPDRLAAALTGRLGGPDASIDLVHASVVFALRAAGRGGHRDAS